MDPPQVLLETELTASPDAPAEARRAIRSLGGLTAATRDRVVAVVSELATIGASQVDGSPFMLRVVRGEVLLRAEVLTETEPDVNDRVRLLTALTVRWGTRQRDPAVVWAEIRPL